tara:strand:- start:68 stop:931 length:864 start_codon:yes stop_codon:yes gene_type:complete
MEMIDVLTKLKEIAEKKPELVKDAVENVEKTNPKVDEGRMKDYLHGEAEKLSREEFLKKHGESLRGFYNAIMGSEDDEDDRPDSMEGKEMKKERASVIASTVGPMLKKQSVKEDIKMTADTPQEANMLMQILKMAGVKPVDASMMGMEPKQDMEPGDDAMGSMQMAKMRDMMMKPDMEKQEETFANTPDEKVQDVDSLVNVHSGGLNRQKKTYPRVSPADNPMAAEDKITEEDLANSLRAQYESFKETYQKAAETKAKPDFLDMDKDGNKTEPMKKAVKDKEEKEKK